MKKYLMLVCCLVLVLVGTNAGATSKYTVDVDVDVTSTDSAHAREKAMTDANRKAFLNVVSRNTDSSYYDKFAAFTNEQILTFIKEVGVSEERSSNYRYAAKLKVLIDGDLLLQYMKENDIPAVQQNVYYALIVPVYSANYGSQPELWEADNLWRLSWEQRGIFRSDNVSFRSIADTSENRSITAEKLENIDRRTISNLTHDNPSLEVYIAKMRPDNFGYLNIDIINAKTGEKSDISVYGKPNERNFNIAIDTVVARIKSQHSNLVPQVTRQSQPANRNNEIVYIYAYNDLSDLVETRKKIASVPEIESVTMLTVATDKARMLINASGSVEQINYAVSRLGYKIVHEGNFYILQKAGYNDRQEEQ